MKRTMSNTNTHSMSFVVTTTTRVATANGLQNVTATLCDNIDRTQKVFDTYEDATAFAQGYALGCKIPFVKPATEPPTLKEGETYVEVSCA